MTPDTENELTQKFTQELLALEESGAGMPFVFTPSQAWYLLSALQLVLRHPGVKDMAFAQGFLRGLADNIQERLCKSPAMAEIARRGWLKEHDV